MGRQYNEANAAKGAVMAGATRMETQVEEERRALKAPEREIKGWKERLATLGRKRSGLLDQNEEGTISTPGRDVGDNLAIRRGGYVAYR